MKKRKKKARRGNFSTFTKKWVGRLMYVAMLDIQLSYLLAFLGKEQEKIRIHEREMDSCIKVAESKEDSICGQHRH
ncbi:MAG: hypothetical protein ACI4VG_03515 [Lachnospiraceae bacterium]